MYILLYFVIIKVADQSASLYGTGSFSKYTAKVTMGTGMFLDINCGSSPEVCLGQIEYILLLLNIYTYINLICTGI